MPRFCLVFPSGCCGGARPVGWGLGWCCLVGSWVVVFWVWWFSVFGGWWAVCSLCSGCFLLLVVGCLCVLGGVLFVLCVCWLLLVALDAPGGFFQVLLVPPSRVATKRADPVAPNPEGARGAPRLQVLSGYPTPGVLVGQAPWIFGNQPNPEGTCALAKLSIWFRYPTPGVLVGQVS